MSLNRGIVWALIVLGATAVTLNAQSPPASGASACQQRVRDAKQAVAASPQNPDAGLQLARALAACHQNAEADEWYHKYVAARAYDYHVWYELGELLLRQHESLEAAAAFRQVLALQPGDTGGELGLATALSALGRFPEALDFYNEVLEQQSSNYDALQGKAFVLHWTRHDSEARPIFESLLKINPEDQENRDALRLMSGGDQARWQALRPPAGAWAGAFVSYYISYLADHPHDEQARWQLAAAEARLGDYSGAIETYRTMLRLSPSDNDARAQLARVLAWDRQYDASIRVLRGVLARDPRNQEYLEELGQVCTWAGKLGDALAVERHLSAIDPHNMPYIEQTARLELRLGENAEASQTLSALVSAHPENRWARLELARVDSRDGRFKGALDNYDAALGMNFQDADALYGAAQINYYLGRFNRAYPLALNLVRQRPRDFDALMLLARIERARHGDPQAVLALSEQALKLDPGNPEAADLSEETEAAESRERAEPEGRVTIHTSASYARELGFESFISSYGFIGPLRPVEDLNTYSAGVRINFPLLPKSQSYVAFSSMPSNSPLGVSNGTVAPSEWLYGQTTEVSKFLALRGGAGMQRLGPGIFEGSPPLRTIGVTGVGYAGFSVFPARKLSLDFTASHNAIPYTPFSVKFGAMETRFAVGASYAVDSRTRLRLEYDHERDSSSLYINRFGQLQENGRDYGNSGEIDFGRALVRSEHFSFSAGYSGRAFGYLGGRRGVFMGFFNPAFYQYHALALDFAGRLAGPVSYSMLAGIGVQQVARRQPFTRALKLGPGLSFRVNPRLSISIGYVHYNFAQSLGLVKGNAIVLTTDWGL
ncbi:MAG: tetratricopeptide repeat protein [Terriglobia bacterium]